jgi:hypothetical protein
MPDLRFSRLTYDCPALGDLGNSQRIATYLPTLQRLQNEALRTIGNLQRSTTTRDLHVAFKIPYLYDYGTKIGRQQAIVILNHEDVNICKNGQGEAQGSDLVAVRHTIDQLSRQWLYP